MLSCPFTLSIFIPEVSSQLPAGAENKHDSLYQVGNFLFEVGSDKIISKKIIFQNYFFSWLPFSVFCIIAEAADIFEDSGAE